MTEQNLLCIYWSLFVLHWYTCIVSDQFRFLFIICQFGGKLVSLENIKPTPQQPQHPLAHVVHVSQVVTDTDFLDRSNQLQATLTAGSFVEFCQRKIEVAQNEFEKTIWAFLKVIYWLCAGRCLKRGGSRVMLIRG